MAKRHPRKSLAALAAAAACALAGCKAPSINLATSEPIKVDIDMRLDVYQHNAPGQASPLATPKPSSAAASERRKDREAEIQVLKNEGVVGEAHDGLLVILNAPAGQDGDEARHTVALENAARMSDMKAAAAKQKVPLTEVQSEQAGLWRNRAFKGEWIEEKQADGSYKWVQKQG
jgi:uncharacterized protein YdbL (DUF1318 family)